MAKSGWNRAMYLSICVLAGLSVTGCIPPRTEIESRRAPELEQPVTDMFVMSEVGSLGEASPERFEQELVQAGSSCGVRVGVSRITKLDLAPAAHGERMTAFGAHHLLTLAVTSQQTTNGQVSRTTYDARLKDLATDKLVWRAEINLSPRGAPSGDSGTLLARTLLVRMNSDKVTPWCRAMVLPGSKSDIEPGVSRQREQR